MNIDDSHNEEKPNSDYEKDLTDQTDESEEINKLDQELDKSKTSHSNNIDDNNEVSNSTFILYLLPPMSPKTRYLVCWT